MVELYQHCDGAGGYNEEFDGQSGMADSIWDGGALLTPDGTSDDIAITVMGGRVFITT